MAESRDTTRTDSTKRQRIWIYVLLGFAGGGIGTFLALLFGMSSWSDARLFVVSGIALGLALASTLAPNLLITRHREASAPKR